MSLHNKDGFLTFYILSPLETDTILIKIQPDILGSIPSDCRFSLFRIYLYFHTKEVIEGCKQLSCKQ